MTENLIRIGESELWWDGDGKLKQSGLDRNSKSVFTDDVDDDDDGDVYIMMKCLSVTKNEHFPLLVIMVMVVMQRGQVLTISYVVHSFHLNRSLSLQLVV